MAQNNEEEYEDQSISVDDEGDDEVRKRNHLIFP